MTILLNGNHFGQPPDAKLFKVTFDVDGGRDSSHPQWRRDLTAEVRAPDAVTAAFLVGYLVGGVPRPIENVKVEEV